MTDRALLPVQSGSLSPFTPLGDYIQIYMPAKYRQVEENSWDFDFPPQLDLKTARLRAGKKYRSFDDFMLEISRSDSQARIIGPVGFPDQFDDQKERYFIHFIQDSRMYTAIYASVYDKKFNKKINIEFVFGTDSFDYFDSLTYAIICNIRNPSDNGVKEIGTFNKCVTIYEGSALKVPLGRNTVEEAVSSFYASLITNRWGKARTYLHPTLDVWPLSYDVLFKERAWWAVKWFRIVYKMVYDEDRVVCVVIKGVRQQCEDQEGIDYIEIKKFNNKWYLTSLQ